MKALSNGGLIFVSCSRTQSVLIFETVGLYVHVGTYPWCTGVVYSACTTMHVSPMICMMKLRNNGVYDSTAAHDSCIYFIVLF